MATRPGWYLDGMRRLHLNVKVAAVAAVVGAVCAASAAASVAQAGSRTAASPRSRTIIIYVRAAKVGKLGSVLVNGAGRVLYVFAPDGGKKKVTCDASCQSFWPAATVPAHAVVKALGAVKQRLIGTALNPVTHELVVTYNGWPLYTYLGDSRPDEATGQNIDLSGGYWWVMNPNGKIDR